MNARSAALLSVAILASLPSAAPAEAARGPRAGRRDGGRRAHLPLRLRAVHRAPRPVHLRGPLGRDARGPEVLLPGDRRGARVGDVHARASRSWEGAGVPYELLVRSPWMVLGDKKAVTMVREGAYAGEHSPRVALPGRRRRGRPRCRSGWASRTAGSTWAASSLAGGRLGRAHRGEPRLGRGRDRPADGDDHGPRRRLRDPRPALPRRAARPTTAGSRSSRAAPARSRSAPSR